MVGDDYVVLVVDVYGKGVCLKIDVEVGLVVMKFCNDWLVLCVCVLKVIEVFKV